MQFRQCLPVFLLLVSSVIGGVAYSDPVQLAANIAIPNPRPPSKPKVIPPIEIQTKAGDTKPSDVSQVPAPPPPAAASNAATAAALPSATDAVTAPSSTTSPTSTTAAPAPAKKDAAANQPKVDPEMAALTTPVGRVVWVKGNFKAIGANSKERPLDKASILYLKDKLLTAENSQAQIVFTDNTLMTFKPNTQFIIEQYAYDPSKKGAGVGKYIMNLLEGGFRTVTGLIAKNDPKSYQVNTPVATIGVRGTDYAVYLNGGELVIGYYKGTPCLSGEGKELCLTKEKPYAEASRGQAPKSTTAQPAVLKEKQTIVPASIAPSDDSNSFGGLMTDSGSSGTTGGGSGSVSGSGDSISSGSSGSSGSSSSSSSSSSSTTTISGSDSGSSGGGLNITGTEIQVNTPKPPSGPVSSFCIVQ